MDDINKKVDRLLTCDGRGVKVKARILLDFIYAARDAQWTNEEFDALEDKLSKLSE